MANDSKLVNLEDLKAAFDDVNSRAGVTGIKGDAENEFRNGDVILTPANIGAVPMSGAPSTNPITGNLVVEKPGSTIVKVSNSNYGTSVNLEASDGKEGKHGLYSNGYYNGSNFVVDGRWMIDRKNDGKVEVKDHYDADYIDNLIKVIQSSAKTVYNIALERSNRHLLIGAASSSDNSFCVYVATNASGSLSYIELGKGNNVTLAASSNALTVTLTSSQALVITDITAQGTPITVS